MVYDEIMYHGGEIKDFPIPTSLLIASQSTHQKFKNDTDHKRAESQKVEVRSNKQKKTTDWRIEHCKEEEDWWREPHQTIKRWFGQVNYRGWGNVRCSTDEVISSGSQLFQEDYRGEGKYSCWLYLLHWKDGGRNKTIKVDETHNDSWWMLLFSLLLQGGGHMRDWPFLLKLAKTSSLLCVVCC